MNRERMSMRPSRVLRQLRAGKAVSCFKVNLADARATEIAAMAGFDCIWTGMEHIGNDWSTLEKQIWAAKAHNVDVMVRVARGSYSDHVKPLELDASGIIVPHVMSLADAQNVVRMTHFHPIGRRPLDGDNADGAYTGIEIADYLRQANEQRFLCLQIEDPEVLDDLEAIASLDGVDMLFFGAFDFSQGIGAPGEMDNPLVVETRRRIADLCLAHGKTAAAAASPGDLEEVLAMGYRFITFGADVAGLTRCCRNLVSEFQADKCV